MTIKNSLLLPLIFILTSCRIIPNPTVFDENVLQWDLGYIESIGLVAITFDDNVTAPNDFAEIFEDGIKQEISETGFIYVPLASFNTIYEMEKTTSNGFFDPITGKKDKKKLRLFNEDVALEYATVYGVDFFISFHFFKTKAKFKSNKAEWHNLTDSTGEVPDILFNNSKGKISALSVTIKGYDYKNGQTLSHSQGLQVLLKNHTATDVHVDDIPLHISTITRILRPMFNRN